MRFCFCRFEISISVREREHRASKGPQEAPGVTWLQLLAAHLYRNTTGTVLQARESLNINFRFISLAFMVYCRAIVTFIGTNSGLRFALCPYDKSI